MAYKIIVLSEARRKPSPRMMLNGLRLRLKILLQQILGSNRIAKAMV